jgi:hypothetical protein
MSDSALFSPISEVPISLITDIGVSAHLWSLMGCMIHLSALAYFHLTDAFISGAPTVESAVSAAGRSICGRSDRKRTGRNSVVPLPPPAVLDRKWPAGCLEKSRTTAHNNGKPGVRVVTTGTVAASPLPWWLWEPQVKVTVNREKIMFLVFFPTVQCPVPEPGNRDFFKFYPTSYLQFKVFFPKQNKKLSLLSCMQLMVC